MTREHRDPYLVLGVGRQASASEIIGAYRRAARATHPDLSVGGTAATAPFQAVSDAYETLRDPRRRAAYDRAHPLVRSRPPSIRRTVAYDARDRQHIVLGVSSAVSEVAPLGRLVLVRSRW
jgi:curved DNA-binding protein CbpA